MREDELMKNAKGGEVEAMRWETGALNIFDNPVAESLSLIEGNFNPVLKIVRNPFKVGSKGRKEG